ncbi:hypothetical protein FDECE_18593, partial [Fusarium decemcellulare]
SPTALALHAGLLRAQQQQASVPGWQHPLHVTSGASGPTTEIVCRRGRIKKLYSVGMSPLVRECDPIFGSKAEVQYSHGGSGVYCSGSGGDRRRRCKEPAARRLSAQMRRARLRRERKEEKKRTRQWNDSLARLREKLWACRLETADGQPVVSACPDPYGVVARWDTERV